MLFNTSLPTVIVELLDFSCKKYITSYIDKNILDNHYINHNDHTSYLIKRAVKRSVSLEVTVN